MQARELKNQLRNRMKEDTRAWSWELKDEWHRESGRIKKEIERLEDDVDCWIGVAEALQEGRGV